MLGPYTTSVAPYCYWCAPVVPTLLLLCPIETRYCYCCALILLLLCQLLLYCDPLDSYIERRFWSFESFKNHSFV